VRADDSETTKRAATVTFTLARRPGARYVLSIDRRLTVAVAFAVRALILAAAAPVVAVAAATP
jgi:hypothetical protein